MVLGKGSACFRCRRQKIKCDGLRPRCSRCTRIRKECGYRPPLERRGPVTEVLEARVLELEILIHKLRISSTHNLSLISSRLQERIGRLGSLPKPRKLFDAADLPTQLLTPLDSERDEVQQQPYDSVATADPELIQKLVEQQLRSYELAELEELPLSLSIHLVNLFLPYRSHYYFLADVSYFMTCLSLPPNHPKSIHPCLLNACYLGACSSTRRGLASFQPYFLQRTQHFLQQSLMDADRPTHFLWASLILIVFFAKERRLVECLALAGATARFAIACGLDLPDHSMKRDNDASPSEQLLPPPVDKAEADERIRLTYAIYVGGQAFPLLCGYPAIFPYDDDWSPISGEAFYERRKGKISTTTEELWRFELHLKVLVTNTFGRATKFARAVAANSDCDMEEYSSIESQIRVQRASFPPLHDPHRRQPLEASSAFNSHSVFGHITLYGSGLILHSLRANYHPQSRAKMFECIEALVDICASAREHRRLHLGLVNVVHIMNAVRVIARGLQRSEVKGNAALSMDHCRSIELLLDFLDDIMLLFPAWVDTPVALKDTLVAAANSLST
ncbi:hypothetical protein DL93DRAFT_1800758 [Clavulina sp. PMI_390]|nr:hypothetical protein DL93DRAFT_1800758 [Clavulina sp. PMI_390]